MKYSNFAKISRLFQTRILYKDVFFLQYTVLINITLHILQGGFYRGLGLINLRWNNSNEVAVTDPIVRNYCIAKKIRTIPNYISVYVLFLFTSVRVVEK